MSQDLDRELAEAARVDESDDEGMSVPQAAEPKQEDEPKKANVGLLLTLLVMVGGIVALFMVGFQEASVYSMPVDQFTADTAKHEGRRARPRHPRQARQTLRVPLPHQGREVSDGGPLPAVHRARHLP